MKNEPTHKFFEDLFAEPIERLIVLRLAEGKNHDELLAELVETMEKSE